MFIYFLEFYQTAALVFYICVLIFLYYVFVLIVAHCRILWFVDRTSLYNLVNKANLVHNFS